MCETFLIFSYSLTYFPDIFQSYNQQYLSILVVQQFQLSRALLDIYQARQLNIKDLIDLLIQKRPRPNPYPGLIKIIVF